MGTGDQPPPRAHRRYDVDWRVFLKCPDWHLAGSVAAANASRGGLFVLTTQPPPVGSIVELGVELPDGTRLSLRGTVQHVVTPERAAATGDAPGIGVKFLEEHETDLVLLEQMAAASSPPRKKSKSVPPQSAAPRRPETGPVIGQIAVKRRVVTPSGEEVASIVGIDFGNSYASIAGALGSRLFTIPDEAQRTLQPCLVHMPERGPALVAWEARELLISEPRATVAAPRRFLGRTVDDPVLAVHLASSVVRVVPAPDRTPRIEVEGTAYDATRLSAIVLGHLREMAERELGHAVGRAVLSVPTHFDELRASALRTAAEAAGFEVAALVPEPICAALASEAAPTRGQLTLVFDLGASTLSVALLEGTGDGFDILASSWEDRLGGDELDLRIAQLVADAFWRATSLELRTRLDGWLRLLAAAERAKRELTCAREATIMVDALVEDPERFDLNQPIDRGVLEKLGVEVVQRCLGVCRLLVDSAGVRPSELGAVVLAGGTSRVPMIRAAVAQLCGRDPISHIQPDEANCLGAGLRATQLVKHRISTIG